MKQLGKTQASVLAALKRHGGGWYDGCGWVWSNYSETTRLMESLVKRGLVAKSEIEVGGHFGGPKFNRAMYRLKEEEKENV
jgi:hypothetical protein